MLKLYSPAKINLFLEITSRREDNFHNLCSVFQTIPLYDEISLIPADSLELDDDCAAVSPRDNLIMKAAKLLQERYDIKAGGKFILKKNIPSCAGLGGGSSNAATALILADRLWNLNLGKEKLAQLGSEIGSDIPFFIYSLSEQSLTDQLSSDNYPDGLTTCLCKGRGEIVTPLPAAGRIPVRVIAPDWGIPTPKAFSLLKQQRFGKKQISEFISELTADRPDLDRLYQLSYNHFEEIVFGFEPRQRELHEILVKNRMLPRMSGSGSAVFLFGSPLTADIKNILPPGCRVIL